VIVLDGRRYLDSVKGTGRYVFNLAEQLARGGDFEGAPLVLLAHEGQSVPPAVPCVRLPRRRHGLPINVPTFLDTALRRLKWDLLHYPGFDLPLTGGGLLAATCYDLEPIVRPSLFRRRIVLYYRALMPRLRRAAVIFAISEHTKLDLVRILGVPAARVVVAPLGADESWFEPRPEADLERVCVKYALSGQWVLYVGNTMPHKNVGGLVRALRRAREAVPGLTLVVAGREDTYRAAVATEIKRNGLESAVRFLGEVSDADLTCLYRLALVFATATLYEGFGLPVLEAMACRTPVVCYETSSLPEVLGDTGRMIHEGDEDGFGEAIADLARDRDECRRLGDRGARRARSFTWRRCAELHREAYLRVLREP
jgi:glycosyltransferase involved in cell wall biosynthesis